jgi:NAD(P)-dependent dehydrogenase (short-subunit alcohol dehydrogenase family)
MKLLNRITVITGACGGLGLSFAKAILAEGAMVVLTDVAEEGFANTVGQLADGPGNYCFYPLDVTRRQQVEKVMTEVYGRYGRIDVLVNAAGGSLFTPKKLEEIGEEDWDKVVDVNLKGTFLCCQAAVKYMARNGYGRIVNVSSIGGRTASIVTGVPYAAAKGGVISLSRRLAAEVGPLGINVNVIAPGTVLSGRRMVDLWNELTEKQQREVLTAIPLGRLSSTEEQAKAVVFLASDDAAYLTGAVIDVNGGRFMG